jgi:hypothetical protein
MLIGKGELDLYLRHLFQLNRLKPWIDNTWGANGGINQALIGIISAWIGRQYMGIKRRDQLSACSKGERILLEQVPFANTTATQGKRCHLFCFTGIAQHHRQVDVELITARRATCGIPIVISY